MPTIFPGSLDSYTNPTAADNLNSPGVVHHVQHDNHNDAISAIEAKLGINLSLVTTSVDYIITLLLMEATQHPKGGYREITGQPFPTLVRWYVDATKTVSLVEKTYIYSPTKNPTTITFKLYDGTVANTVLRTITDTITYSGPFELTRTRVVT